MSNSLKRLLQKTRLLAQQDGRCFYCAVVLTAQFGTIDHLMPTSKGGDNHHLNKVCACRTCNKAKGDRMPTEAEMQRAARMKGISTQYYRAIRGYLQAGGR